MRLPSPPDCFGYFPCVHLIFLHSQRPISGLFLPVPLYRIRHYRLFAGGLFELLIHLQVENQYSPAHTGWVSLSGELKCHISAIVTYYRVRTFVAGILSEKSQPFAPALSVQAQLVNIDIIGAFAAMSITFDRSIFAVGEDEPG